MTPILTLSGITKTFPGVHALSGVSLDLFAGQVTALIGENGAGKSTLVKILTGIYQPDQGQIALNGALVSFPSAKAAIDQGITAIHQETVLFDDLSVAENIFLGHPPRGRFGLIDWAALNEHAKTLLDSIGAKLDVTARLRDLAIAQRHLVAVARALSVDARIVIMDEPSAALSHHEVEELFALIGKLKADGRAVLFISHKFEEVFRIADRYTVFRDGEHVQSGLISEVTQDDLVRLMVGRDVGQVFPTRTEPKGPVVLEAEDLGHDREFANVSFTLGKGEILGFYGLVGAGRTELMQVLFGIAAASHGTVRIDGKPVAIRSPNDAISHGLVYVPEERGRHGAVLGFGIAANVTLPSLRQTARHGFLRMAREFALARTYVTRLDLRAAALDQDVATLSGGNQQKVVIAKWLATKPRIIILDEPTKGIDIGSKAAVHAFMAELASEGLAVIMVSSEIPEVLGMSDRIIVMREGRMVAELDRAEASPELLVRYAAGIAA